MLLRPSRTKQRINTIHKELERTKIVNLGLAGEVGRPPIVTKCHVLPHHFEKSLTFCIDFGAFFTILSLAYP